MSDNHMREAFAALGERAPTRETCPAPEEIWDASTGKSDEETTLRLIEHTSDCPACAEEWRLAHGIGKLVESRRSALSFPGAFRWVAAAAAVLVLVIGVYVLERSDGDGTRSSASTVIHSLIEEERALPRERCVLRWSPGPEGTRYNVRVLTEGGVAIDGADSLTENVYRVEPEALRVVEPGGRILWRVEARFPDERRAESVTFIHTIQ